MPASTTHPLSPPAGSTGNAYTHQLHLNRRSLQAERDIELKRRLHRDAEQAAFASLMRTPRPRGRASAPTPSASATGAFEQAVADRLLRSSAASGRIGYIDRMNLYRRASSLGLSRFDANLLIARVQHYHTAAAGAGGSTPAAVGSGRRRLWLWLAAGAIVLLVQGLLAVLWLSLLR